MASVLRFDDWETTLGTGVVSTDGSGNVAVGGSSPSYKLDVTGDINASGDLRIGGTAIGEYTNYSGSVTFTNFTLGNGTASAYYAVVNDLVHFWGGAVLGSTSSVTGRIEIDLPLTAQVAYPNPAGWATLDNAGVSLQTGIATFLTTTAIALFALNNVSNWIRGTATSASAPFVWGTGDALFWNVVYKKA